jgi:hypothetical protein
VGPPFPLYLEVYHNHHTHSVEVYTAGRCSIPAHLLPKWRFSVWIEGGRLVPALAEASIARHAIEAKRVAQWPVPGRCASPGRRVGDVRLLKTSSRLLFTELAGPYASN